MHELHFYPRLTCLSDGLCYLTLRLPARTFSKFVGKEAPPAINLPAFFHGWLSALVFLFLQCVYSYTSDILFFWLLSRVSSWQSLKVSALFLRVLSVVLCSDVFEGGCKIFKWTWGRFMRNLVLKICLDIHGGLSLISMFTCTFGRYCLVEFLRG